MMLFAWRHSKAGEFDAIVEYRAKIWAKGYVGSKFDNGTLTKKAFINHNGAGMQGFAMNIRRPIFKICVFVKP
jgi:microcin C transport system substrate-binding protein